MIFINKVAGFFTFLAGVAISLDILILLGGVFSRYILGFAPIWIDEITRYLMIASVLLAAATVLLENKQMRLNIIEKIQYPRVIGILKIYQNLIIVAICAFMSYFSFKYALSISNFVTIGLGVSKTIPMLAVPAGFIMLLFASLMMLINSITKFIKNL